MGTYKYLIVGGGMTADAAVKGIREVDPAGSIGVITEEADPPYKRPPLSKALWTGKKTIDDIWCATEKKGAEVIRATRVVSLDMAGRNVMDAAGRAYRYERLLLATGGSPRTLPFGKDHVVYYRTSADYRRVRAMVEEGREFAVLGGGFIGSEMAAALALNGRKVTMVFPEASVGALILPLELARAVTRYYEAKGVGILSGKKCSGIDVEAGERVLRLEDGHRLRAEGILAGIGLIPNTGLAGEAGLEVGNGIVVDERLRTRDPLVYAAGDAAEFYHAALGRRMRVEHEDNALMMGETAGRNMAGEELAYRHMPSFYSDLFDLGYEAVGETDSSMEVVTEVAEPHGQGPIFYIREGRVRGIVFWNLFGHVDAGRELIVAPGAHTRDSLRAWSRERLAT